MDIRLLDASNYLTGNAGSLALSVLAGSVVLHGCLDSPSCSDKTFSDRIMNFMATIPQVTILVTFWYVLY